MSGISNQLFGMMLLTLTTFVMLSVTVLLLDPADAVTATVLTLILLGATFIVRRFDALWAIALGLLVSIGATLTVFYLAFGISQVFSPIEFMAGLLLVVGFFFATIGGVAALVRHRRGSEPGGTRLRQMRPRPFGAEPVRVVTGSNQQRCGNVGSDPVARAAPVPSR